MEIVEKFCPSARAMVGPPSAPVQIGRVRMRDPYDAMSRRTKSTADLLGVMTDFIESDLYYTSKVSMHAASVRLNKPPWSLLGRTNEEVPLRALPKTLSSVSDLPGPPSFQRSAVHLSRPLGLQSLSVCERRLHAAAGADNFVEQAAQPARRTLSMVLSIAER